MNRALAYGLMGAASGVLHGVYDQWQQNQQDIRNAALLKAKMQEEQQLTRMKAQYDSAVNLQKIEAQLQANMKQDAANNAAKANLQTQKDQFDAQQGSLDRASRQQVANTSAGAAIQAAKIRSADNSDVKPRLVAVKGKDGTINVQAVKPGDSLPAGSEFMNFSGDPQFAPLPMGMLGNFGAPTTAAPSPGAAGAPPKTVGNPGASAVQGASDPSQGATPYPEGTRLVGPGGKPYVVRNGQPVPVGP